MNSFLITFKPAAESSDRAVGYITPKDMLAGRQQEIHADSDWKLEAARTQRQIRRQHAA